MPDHVRKSLAVKSPRRDILDVAVDVVGIDVDHRSLAVHVLEQLLPGQLLASFEHTRGAWIGQLDVVQLPAFSAKPKGDMRAVNLHVAVAHGGQAKRLVVPGVLVVSDPDVGRIQEMHDRGYHAFPGSTPCVTCPSPRGGGSAAAPWRTPAGDGTWSHRAPPSSAGGSGTACGRERRGLSPAGARSPIGRSTRRSTPAGSPTPRFAPPARSKRAALASMY